MSKESFQYRDTSTLFKQLEEVSQRSSVSRGQAFEDFLQATVCSLGHPLMEKEYHQAIDRHKEGTMPNRGVDKLKEMFHTMVDIVSKTHDDVLGDLFQGAITYGERGQFLTPDPLCDLMARMNLPSEPTDIDGRRTVNDPCCGSGRMLLAAARIQPHWQFIGQDIDLRCVQMTAINLGLRNRYGHVVHANTLRSPLTETPTGDEWTIYETGRVHLYGNAIRKVQFVNCPAPTQHVIDKNAVEAREGTDDDPPPSQLELFY